MVKIILVLGLLSSILLSACTDTDQQQDGVISPPPTDTQSNITKPVDLTNDCSKVVIPLNVERNTDIDKEKGIIKVYWLDQTTGENVGVMYKYGDQNCSESAKEMAVHVLED